MRWPHRKNVIDRTLFPTLNVIHIHVCVSIYIYICKKFYMLYSIPMYLQYESKPKRLRIVYLPPTIVVGFKNPYFQTLISFFLDGVFLKIIKCSRQVRDHFSYLYNHGFHHTTLLLPPCISSCWNVLLNPSGRGMVEAVIKVLDHIMKCWTTWWTCSANILPLSPHLWPNVLSQSINYPIK